MAIIALLRHSDILDLQNFVHKNTLNFSFSADIFDFVIFELMILFLSGFSLVLLIDKMKSPVPRKRLEQINNIWSIIDYIIIIIIGFITIILLLFFTKYYVKAFDNFVLQSIIGWVVWIYFIGIIVINVIKWFMIKRRGATGAAERDEQWHDDDDQLHRQL